MTVSLDRSSLDASSRPKVGTEGEGAAGGGVVSKCKPARFFFLKGWKAKRKREHVPPNSKAIDKKTKQVRVHVHVHRKARKQSNGVLVHCIMMLTSWESLF